MTSKTPILKILRFIGVVLAEALKANDMYKTRLKTGKSGRFQNRLSKASWVSDVDVPGKSTDEDGAGNEGRECKVSMLEIEIDRYTDLWEHTIVFKHVFPRFDSGE
ncbi:hypothetical protein V6N13_142872 [Hibiscus sabdariffa]